MTLAWAPPQILRSRAPTEIWNALLSRCGEPAPLLGKGVAATFEPGAAPAGSSISALIESGGDKAVIVFKSFPFAALFGSDVAVEDLDRLPLALRDVLVEGMLSSLWNVIPQNRLAPFSVVRIGGCEELCAEVGALDWLAATVQGLAPQPVQLLVGCFAAEVVRAMAGGELASRAVWTGLREHLSADAFFTLARIELPLARIKTLRPGSIVVLPGVAADACFIRLDRELHEFRSDAEEWTYSGSRSLNPLKREAHMSDEDEMDDDAPAVALDPVSPDAPAGEPPGLSSLLLDIDFDLGAVRLPLSTLETWRAGSLVELDPPSAKDGVEVTLRANGQALATGDLIRIDDRLAVRLNRLLIGT